MSATRLGALALMLALVAPAAAAERAGLAHRLLQRAVSERRSGAWEACRATALRAVSAARAEGDRALEAWALNELGDALYALRRPAEAVAAFERATTLFAGLGDRRAEAMLLKNLGIAYGQLGRRDLAMMHLEQALQRRPDGADASLEVSILGNLGTIYFRLGAPRAALRSYERALALAGCPEEKSDVLGRLGQLALHLDRFEDARRRFEAALEAAGEAGPAFELALLEGASAAWAATGDEAAAEAALERLLALHRRAGNAVAVCQALVGVGNFAEARRPEDADRAYRQAASMTVRGETDCRWLARAGLARLLAAAGERDAAIDLGLAAIAEIAQRRSRLIAEVDRSVLAARSERAYRDLVRLLLERGAEADLERAFSLLAESRAPALAQAMAESELEVPADLPGAQQRALERLSAEIHRLRRRLADEGLGEDRTREILLALARRESELDEHLRNLRRAGSRRQPPAATVGHFRHQLPAHAALVAFVLDDTAAFALVVTSDGLSVAPLPARRATVADQVAGFVDLLRQPDGLGWQTVGHRLYQDLVAPWRARLDPGIRRVVIVPDRDLASLPFEALPTDAGARRLLLEDLAIAYAPSAMLGPRSESAGEDPSAPVTVIGDPDPRPAAAAVGLPRPSLRSLYEEDGHALADLPFGRREAREVAVLAGGRSRLLIGAAATEAGVKAMIVAPHGLLHFATHGLIAPGDPRRSALLLAPDAEGREDGFLQAREIEQLRLPADLVVLSACRTARGRALAGEGVQSLATAFFRAGARSVVGTLWDVGDRRAMRLMTAFYRRLGAGEAKVDALRAAKLEALAEGAAPAEWAGFVLLGEPFDGVALERAPADRGIAVPLVVVALALAAGAGLYAARRGSGTSSGA